MKILTVLISLLFLISCTPGKVIIPLKDDQVAPKNNEKVQDLLVDEKYIQVNENFNVEKLGDNFNGTIVTRYQNGKIKDISTYENNHVVFSELFDEGGYLVKKYESKDDGFSLIIYENNLISSSQTVSKNSSVKITYENGIISNEFTIKDKLNSQKHYNENGKLDFIISTVEGENKILYQKYDVNNNLSLQYQYYNLNGEQIYDGTYTEYFPNGNLKTTKEFVNNVLTGNITIFHENGSTILQCYNYDKSNSGLCYTYHDNGRLDSKYEFDNNNVLILNGRSYFWYENGYLKKVGIIRNDKLVGKHINYYENGNLNEVTNYNNEGIVNGLYKLYHENGQLKYIVNYLNGNREGLFKQYFENGSISYEMYYKNDKLHGKYIQFYDDGRIRQEGFYKNGMKDGFFITRDYEGKIVETTEYKNDIPIK